MLMEEVSCNSGAEEFRVIGDTETSGQIFNQPKNYQNSLHQNSPGDWTTPGPVYGSQAPCAPPGDTSHISVGDNFISGFYTCAHPRYALCYGPKRFYTRARGRPVSRIHDIMSISKENEIKLLSF